MLITRCISKVIHALTVYLLSLFYALTVYLLRINGLPTSWKAIHTNAFRASHICTYSYYPVVIQKNSVGNPKT